MPPLLSTNAFPHGRCLLEAGFAGWTWAVPGGTSRAVPSTAGCPPVTLVAFLTTTNDLCSSRACSLHLKYCYSCLQLFARSCASLHHPAHHPRPISCELVNMGPSDDSASFPLASALNSGDAKDPTVCMTSPLHTQNPAGSCTSSRLATNGCQPVS